MLSAAKVSITSSTGDSAPGGRWADSPNPRRSSLTASRWAASADHWGCHIRRSAMPAWMRTTGRSPRGPARSYAIPAGESNVDVTEIPVDGGMRAPTNYAAANRNNRFSLGSQEVGLSGLEGLREQDRDWSRSDASGNRRDEAGSFAGAWVLDVSDVAGVVTGVEDDGTGLDPVSGYANKETRPSPFSACRIFLQPGACLL